MPTDRRAGHSPLRAGDLDVLKNFERLLAPQVSGCSRDCSKKKSPDNCQGFIFKSERGQESNNG
jgi:hypothetical protein